MRILHVDTGRTMRGGQWQVWFLLREFAAMGHEQILLARHGSPLLERARSTGIDARPVTLSRLFSRRAWADIVHVHDARAHTSAALIPWRGPLIVARRVAFPVRRGLLSRWKYRRADRYIAVSAFVKSALVDANIDPSRVSVVHDCVPLLVPRPADGRIIAPAFDDPAKGSDLARATGLDVTFSRDLQRDLPGASVFLYLTRAEGLGSAALLAMAAGVPVVASNVGGLPEAVIDGVTGLLTSNDPADAAARVRALLADPALAARFAAAALERVDREFTPRVAAERTLAVYRESLTIKHGPERAR